MPFKIAQITDSHLYAYEEMVGLDCADAFFAEMVEQTVVGHGAELLLHTGDLCNGHCGVAYHQRFKALCDRLSHQYDVPILLTRGNHDATISDWEYQSVYGDGTYLKRHRDWAILVIDRYAGRYEHTQHAFAMSADTLDQVEQLLTKVEPYTPLIVALHDDPIGVSRFWRGPELVNLLQQYSTRLLLFGHVQANYIGRYAGIPFVTVVGDDRPHDVSCLCFNIITCDDAGHANCDFVPIQINTPDIQPTPLPKGSNYQLGDSWPCLRGPDGTRALPTVNLGQTPPTCIWRQSLPGGFGVGSPTLDENRLVLASISWGQEDNCRITAMNPATGEAHWQQPLDGDAYGGVRLHQGKAYVGTTTGSMYCFDLDQGQVIWRWNNRDRMPIACEPWIDEDGLVHAGANWEMYGIDDATGRTRWRSVATTHGFPYMGPGCAAPLVVDDRVWHQRTFNATVVGTSQLQSVHRTTGTDLKVVSPQPSMHPRYRQASPIEATLPDERQRVLAVANGLVIVDPEQPDHYEHFLEHTPGGATPACNTETCVVSYHDEIVAYDLMTMQIRWCLPHEPAAYHFAEPVQAKYGSRFGVPAGAYASPLIAGDAVLIADLGGHLRCLNLDDGQERWRLILDEPILSAPSISGRTLFIAGYFGSVWALTMTGAD